MEHRKKAKTDDYGKRTQSLPTDLITEILLRLPEKSVARFSCVSKLWSSITTDPSFISSFETRSSRQRLLLCLQKGGELFVSSIPQHTQNSNMSYSSSLSFDHHHMTKFKASSSSTESVHGLICFESENPIVWNPSTRQFVTLPTIPKPCKSWKETILFLGYDPIEGKHKVVCIPDGKTCYVCRVYTLGSVQESWRTVKINHKHRSSWDTVGRCINGVIYYLTFPCQGDDYIVMSFDVRSEKFNMIKLPSGFCGHFLVNYKGRLACFNRYDHSRFWILEDAQKHKWSSQDILSPFGDCGMETDFNLTGFTHAGEFIYVPNTFRHLFYTLLYDPVRNSWRRFEFKEMAGDKSVSNGLVREYRLHAFPNHIDSQISL
ncbi:putative F-box protein At1g47790 [Brassica rapa]|uniref:F-box domain-containing protein n=1 Tax=Brassica campestris TaxID=3711 RepID=M4EE15_BRACM|nr:putative F-box protein At1g47790 [Brassica rapa]